MRCTDMAGRFLQLLKEVNEFLVGIKKHVSVAMFICRWVQLKWDLDARQSLLGEKTTIETGVAAQKVDCLWPNAKLRWCCHKTQR
jgi:hypothetical protein